MPGGAGAAGPGGMGAGWYKGAAGGLLGLRAPFAGAPGAGAGPGAPRLGARYGFGGGVLARSPEGTASPRRPSPVPLAEDQLAPLTPQDQLTKFVEQL